MADAQAIAQLREAVRQVHEARGGQRAARLRALAELAASMGVGHRGDARLREMLPQDVRADLKTLVDAEARREQARIGARLSNASGWPPPDGFCRCPADGPCRCGYRHAVAEPVPMPVPVAGPMTGPVTGPVTTRGRV